MDTIRITDDNVDKLCRICLKKKKLLINIFTVSSKLGGPITNAIISCAPVHITKNDGLPPSICKPCNAQLETAYSFQNAALKSDKALQKYINHKQKQLVKSHSAPSDGDGTNGSNYKYFDMKNNVSNPDIKVEIDSTSWAHFLCEENVCQNATSNKDRGIKLENECDSKLRSLLEGKVETKSTTIKKKSKKLAQSSDDNYTNYKCVDTKNAVTNNSEEDIKSEISDDSNSRQFPLEDGANSEKSTTNKDEVKLENDKAQHVNDTKVDAKSTPVTVKKRKYSTKMAQCDLCFKYYNRSSLYAHKRRHTGNKPYSCEICTKSFFRPADLRLHISKHTGEKKYQCDICDNFFTRKYYLNFHKKKHLGEKNYQCDICGKRFVLPYELLAHKRKHTGEKVYQCEICGKGFADCSSFYAHKRAHTLSKPPKTVPRPFKPRAKPSKTVPKPFKCDVCNRCFSKKATLKTHGRVHTGEKPYQCDVCTKRFSSLSSYRKHVRKHAEQP